MYGKPGCALAILVWCFVVFMSFRALLRSNVVEDVLVWTAIIIIGAAHGVLLTILLTRR